MAFKVNNLMIHVLPDVGEKPLSQLAHAQAQDCGIPFISPLFRGPCTAVTTDILSPACLTFGTPSDPETLATLKVQLQDALAHVQAQEQAINAQMSPQTVEEAQALEDHLTAALDEVRRQKEELQKKAAGGQG